MDIIAILKMGLPGLVFLLSMMSFRLLSKEQSKEKPSVQILKTIRHYMFVNISLAILTVSASLIDTNFALSPKVFNAEAKLSGTQLLEGRVAVCSHAQYSGRYILISDRKNTKMIQLYAMGILPCSGSEVVALNVADAKKLGWNEQHISTIVEIAAAEAGQKYILQNI